MYSNSENHTPLPDAPQSYVQALCGTGILETILHIESMARTTAHALHNSGPGTTCLCSMGDVVDIIGDFAGNFPERLAAYLYHNGFRLEA